MKLLKFSLWLFILASSGVYAEMYKCTDDTGKVSYGTSPCKETEKEKVVQKPSLASKDGRSHPDEKSILEQQISAMESSNAGLLGARMWNISALKKRLHDVTVYGNFPTPKILQLRQEMDLAIGKNVSATSHDSSTLNILGARLHDETVAEAKKAAKGDSAGLLQIDTQEQSNKIEKLQKDVDTLRFRN
ncbi:DUF4124 domain-containing protein [Methylomonas sp. 2BW1-5-20]|uniref:DUF4124 domain-containing protein n=1 Tax=Methylomonas sp. 2BW1-5-20 TaxID=3376686 RepID=UPI004051655F